eukprot:TRINITY_DN2163_c0_g1_i1.p1 TRINITY_DN2163_c0_g1~~TRINITY_DN2163_c0_g1_i1.p1  ORF type:complete len:145 (-),score=15.73 TRINITY_DN2163_c0_g1_i1:41-475(-)
MISFQVHPLSLTPIQKAKPGDWVCKELDETRIALKDTFLKDFKPTTIKDGQYTKYFPQTPGLYAARLHRDICVKCPNGKEMTAKRNSYLCKSSNEEFPKEVFVVEGSLFFKFYNQIPETEAIRNANNFMNQVSNQPMTGVNLHL